MKKRFTSEELLADDVIYEPVEDIIISVGRWSIHHRIVFEREGKFWLGAYSVGATESQDECPWQNVDEVECVEVELKEVLKKVWMPV